MSQQCDRADALAVLKRLREAGHIAYFAGGCVRDELLGLTPKDFDIATDAPPDRVRQLFTSTQAVGAAFGVILVRHGQSVVEVATFRTDLEYHDGRRPQGVKFTTAEEDAQRRDFTINGLFLDPIENRVIDYVGGQADLNKKILRAIGNPDQRFAEDHLRLLRAIRFASRFALQIDPLTATAIKAHAHELPRISPERIGDELRRMLTSTTRIIAWRLLWQFELLPVIFRQLPKHFTGKPYCDRHSSPIFENLVPEESVSFGLALAALLLCYRHHAAGLPDIRTLLTATEIRVVARVCRASLKLSNFELDELASSLDVLPLLNDTPPGIATMKRFLARPTSLNARQLLNAMRRSGSSEWPRIQWLENQFTELEKTDFAPVPLITGDDLTAAGFSPGPAFKEALIAAYDAQLEDRIQTRDQAMQIALQILKK